MYSDTPREDKIKDKRVEGRKSVVSGIQIGLIGAVSLVGTVYLTEISEGKLICCNLFGIIGLIVALYKIFIKGILHNWIYKE